MMMMMMHACDYYVSMEMPGMLIYVTHYDQSLVRIVCGLYVLQDSQADNLIYRPKQSKQDTSRISPYLSLSLSLCVCVCVYGWFLMVLSDQRHTCSVPCVGL